MNENRRFPILILCHRMITIFGALSVFIGGFVTWGFIQASSHVTKVEPITIDRGFDYNVVMAEYIDKGRALPEELELALTLYRLASAEEKTRWFWQEGLYKFYACPGSPEGWDSFVEILEAEVIVYPTFLKEESVDAFTKLIESAQYGIFAIFRERIEAKWRLINIVRNTFELGVPPSACSISLALAIDGRLNEEGLSFAAEALKRGGYIAVSLSVHNDSNAAATGVTVSGPEGFQCMYPEPRQGSQCGPFDLEIDEEKPLLFRADEPALFAEESDLELAAMFKLDWKRWEGPDKPRILFLLKIAAFITAAIVGLDFLSASLVQTWGKIVFGIIVAFFLLSVVVFIHSLYNLALAI